MGGQRSSRSEARPDAADAVKVIASDLDGTLLDEHGALTERTRRVLHAARELGVAVVAVTARPPRVFDEWASLSAALDAAICSNGAIVYDPAARDVIATRTLAPETAAAVAKTLRAVRPSLRFAVETGLEVVAEPGYARTDAVGDRRVFAGTLGEVLAAASQIVKLLVHDAQGHADELLAVARAAGLSGVELSHSGGSGLVEISAAGVSKAATLESWCAARDIGAADVIAFGDAPNDVPMLAWAGRSYAVANAHPEAVAAATARCGHHRADGVAETVAALLAGLGSKPS
ncbi:HAD family hydrolase [Glycomyces tarimensis]